MKGRRSSSRGGNQSPGLGPTAESSPLVSMDHPITTPTTTTATSSGRPSRSVAADASEKTTSRSSNSNNSKTFDTAPAPVERPKRTSTRVRTSSSGNLGTTTTAQAPRGAKTNNNNNSTTKKSSNKATAATSTTVSKRTTTTSESVTAAAAPHDSKSSSSLRRGHHHHSNNNSNNNKRVLTRQRSHNSTSNKGRRNLPTMTTTRSSTTAPTLTAILDAASPPITVRILLAEHVPYMPSPASASSDRYYDGVEIRDDDYSDAASPPNNSNNDKSEALIDYFDGNQYNCQVCSEFGDVVCCDGCPRVYHHQCIPEGPSRQALDQDEDPWYCPECTRSNSSANNSSSIQPPAVDDTATASASRGTTPPTVGEATAVTTTTAADQHTSTQVSAPNDGTSTSGSGHNNRLSSRRRFTSQNKCADCFQDRPTLRLAPCRGCGTYVHTPSCDPAKKTEDALDKKQQQQSQSQAQNSNKGTSKKEKKNNITYCANCRAIDRDDDDDDDHEEEDVEQEQEREELDRSSQRGAVLAKKRHSNNDGRQQLSTSIVGNRSNNGDSKNNKASGEQPSKRKLKRKKSMTSSPADATGRKMKKKKRRKSSTGTNMGGDEDGSAGDHYNDDDNSPEPPEPPVKAMPAFCFYLAENRFKIERALSKSHRTFNRMPKGDERNAVIAGEAADWWTTQLSEAERREYIAMSMRDFEARVVQWKEEKTIRAMQMGEDEEYLAAVDDAVAERKFYSSGAGGDGGSEGAAAQDDGNLASAATMDAGRGDSSSVPGLSLSEPAGAAAGTAEPLVGSSAAVASPGFGNSRTDALLTYEKHERLFLNSSVGCKPFRPEPGQSYNRVLLDVLHDMRFHPLPMFCVNRPDHADQVIDEHNSKVTIPYFDVHGPIATSIGDECLGCSRGWTHYCPVLQRRIPAVEHRARLQPPLSSLVSTRVGLGLRPRPDAVPPHQSSSESSANAVLFQWRDSDEARKIKALPVLPSATLTDPSERMDDLVHFIEETTAMKVPEPPRPIFPDKIQWQKQQQQNRRPLPLQQSSRQDVATTFDGRVFNKCGRCRTLIETDTGCHQCRRAQLVIHKSRKSPSDTGKSSVAGVGAESDKSLLKAHTAVLGRVQAREISINALDETDLHVSEAMLKERWCPSAILPPQITQVPTPKPIFDDDEGSGPSDDVYDDSVSESVDNNSSTISFHSTTAANTGKRKSNNDSSGITPMETIPEESSEVMETGSQGDESGEGPSRPPKRTRLARTVAAAREIADREKKDQEIHKLYKKESTELHRKTIQVSCYSIFLALVRRDPFHVFAEPVNAEGYTALVLKPIDFGIIREKLLSEKYTSLSAFVADVKLLCNNALAYNPPASLYYKTAKDMLDVVDVMQKRAFDWIGTIKDAHTNYLLHQDNRRPSIVVGVGGQGLTMEPFEELREKWPEAVQMLESEETLRKSVESDFMRTQENEIAYYGALAVRRTAAAAEASLAPYPDTLGMHSAVAKRTFHEDEELRRYVDSKVITATQPLTLQNVSTWREESLVRLMRKVQKIRLERKTITEHGCSRCDGVLMDNEWKTALNADATHPGKPRKKGDGDVPRVDHTRILLSTGLGSAKTCQKIVSRQPNDGKEDSGIDSIQDACVSVRGSRIHGMGLYADQPFVKDDIVAEYIGEYIVNPVAEKREKIYGEQRIQDYQFRLDDKLIIDATKKGGHGRYINHNCTPNCRAKIIPGEPPHEHLRRVIIVAQRGIDLNEEITYDYQFPLELDLEARIPCNCQSDACRGFMNWDLPEKGSNNRALLVQKRGANMRDRIRRLGRPLKRDEAY